ncbi:MAG: hypothetical protein WCG61_02045 [Chlorobium sp.]
MPGERFFLFSGCSKRESIITCSQFDGKEFAIPAGTVADTLVLTRLPNAKFKYFNNSAAKNSFLAVMTR